jgi:hypothetical protein
MSRPDLAWCPERRELHVRMGWVIAAESWPTSRGVVWDVRAEHDDGNRVPPGRNWHDDPGPEMRRLAAMIEGPAAAPPPSIPKVSTRVDSERPAPSIPKVSTRVDTGELTARDVVRYICVPGIRTSSAEALVTEYGRQRVASFAASDGKQARAFAIRIAELEAELRELRARAAGRG